MTKYRNYNNTEQYDVTIDYQGTNKILKKLLKNCKSMHYYKEDDPTYGQLTQTDEKSLVKAINGAKLVDKLCYLDKQLDDDSYDIGEHDFDLSKEKHFVLEFPQSNRAYNFDLFDADRTMGKNKIIQANISELLEYAQKSNTIFGAKDTQIDEKDRFVWFDDDNDAKKLLTDKPDLEHDFYGRDLNKLCHDLLYGMVLDIKPIKTPDENKTTRHILFSEPFYFEHDTDDEPYFNIDQFLLNDCHLTKLPIAEQVEINKEEQND